LLRLDNLTLGESIDAILSLLPLDSLVDDAACRMRVDGKPDELPPVQQEAQRVIDVSAESGHTLAGLERRAFYERAKHAYAVVLTGERRFYGTALLRKGVIQPPA
jgi:L-fucose mutarotase